MAEIDRQRAVIARQQMEIDHLVAWAASDRDALMTLQAIYRNPNTPEGNRLKAASAALGFELAKPPSLSVVAPVKLFDILEEKKRRQYVQGGDGAVVIEHEPPGKVIEQAPPDDAA
jgi:hypothetical protein